MKLLAWKVATLAFAVLAAAVVALDPTVKVAIIAAIPGTITGLITVILGIINHRTQQEMRVSVDGNFKRMLDERALQTVELKDQSDKLSHAQGRREGIEFDQNKKE